MQSKRNSTSHGLIALILGTVLFSGSSASAAITANGTISSAQTLNATSLTWSHTVAAGTNRVLFVELAIDGLGANVTGVTYGGVALTQVGRGTGNHAIEIWRLINPTVGTANVVASFSGSTPAAGGATTFNGVHQTTPTGAFVSATGTGLTASVTAASAAGELVIDAQYWKNTTANIVGAGQTSQWSASNVTMLGGSTSEPGAASVIMTGTCGASSQWEIGAVSIRTDGVTGVNISGTVFEDVNYGGGAGRNWATASANGGSARPNARVELFNSSTGAFIISTTTNTSGLYTFASVTAGSYAIRVVSSGTFASSRGGTTALRSVLTYRTDASTGTAVDVTNYVGGQNPAVADAGNAAAGWVLNTTTGVFSGSGSGTAHAFAPVTLSGASVTGVDFGFNFDSIVNKNDSGQGSLRQFITNANTLGGDASLSQSGLVAGKENAVFMISNGTAAAGLRAANNYFAGGVATISPASALTVLTTPMVLNAQLQPGWTNKPVVDLNGAGAGNVNGLELAVGGSGSTIRGLIVRGFAQRGIYVDSDNNTFAGNYLGTSADGNSVDGDLVGIYVRASTGNLIGGTGANDGNLISGNTVDGVQLDAVSTGNLVQGNLIGLNAAGTAAVPNANQGIAIIGGSANNTIGGTTAAHRNVISGNGGEGIRFTQNNTDFNVVIGNYIGTNVAGDAGVPNAVGVYAEMGAANNTIGGTAAGTGNVIAYNTTIGVSITGNGTSGYAVLGNSIFSNGALGIDLVANGVTLNNGTKAGTLPNTGMDFPVFTSASLGGTTLTVAGYVGSAAGQAAFANSRVEIFKSDNDASGYGEGPTYLGFLTTSVANGNFSGSIDVSGKGLVGGDRITGTATDTTNNTSEFGPNFIVVGALSGIVFEDVNYGGGAGRDQAASSGVVRSGARVELYNNAGTYVTFTTTNAAGTYTFSGIAAGNYTVRVVNATVTSSRTGYVAGLLPVQTYRTNASSGSAVAVTDYVGGQNPAVADAGNGAAGCTMNTTTGVFTGGGCSGTAQSITNVTLESSSITGMDFGFNFDTIVNINNTGQGSLRQFITNANTLTGDASLAQSGLVAAKENAVFMISNGTAASGLRASNNYFTGGVATISPTSALPAISTVMVLDAQKQPGWGSVPIIELNGTGAGGATRGLSLSIGSAGSAIRGLVINRFGSYGVYVASANNVIAGNYIGTNAGGTAGAGNGNHGVMIDGAAGNTIGGTTAASRNVISGHTPGGSYGVLIGNAGATGNVVQGNYIGLNAAGTAAVANAGGVYVSTANNTIGGTAAGAGNVISGNTFDAVDLNTATATGNVVQGNFLGTDASGTLALGGGYGVNITGGASNNTVGGTAANAGNLISGSTAGGVMVQGASTGNAILGNSIYSNTNATGSGLGIDLGANGVTANNGTKTAGQPNLLMDFPVSTLASLSGTTLTVSGYVGSAPNQATFANARVELFKADNDPTGYGEGQTYLGFLTADANGNFSGSLDVTGKGLNVGDRITGTATDAGNNTSEFGANYTCTLPTLAIVKQTWNLNGSAPLGSPVSAPAGATLVFLIYVKNTTAGQVTDVRINDLLDQTGFDYVSGSLVRTLAASPPADTATDKQLFDATDPGTGTALSDAVDGDAGSAQDTGAPAGVDRITVGAVSGQANGSLTINAHTAFALRFNVKIK